MALPGQNTLLRDMRDSAFEISQGKPIEISNNIYAYEPNQNKALTYMMMNGGFESSGRRTFGHLEKAGFSQWVEYAGADESSQATTGMVFDAKAGAKLTTGSRIFNIKREETIRIDAAFASLTTSAGVNRNFGRGNATTSLWQTGDKCLILPPNFQEGFLTGEALTKALTYKSFEMSETNYPIEATNVERAENARNGDPFLADLRDTLKTVKNDKEAEMFFGAQLLDNSTYTQPIGSSEGFDNFITSNVYSANTLSRMDFFDILTEVSVNCPYPLAILCSTQFMGMVTQWAMDVTQINVDIEGITGDGMLGFKVNKVRWVTGTYDLIDNHLLSQQEDLMGKVYFVPLNPDDPFFVYRPLVGNGQNLDVKVQFLDVPTKHSHQAEIYGVYGWHFKNEELWAKIEDLEFGG